MGIRLLAGRMFDAGDTQEKPEVAVSVLSLLALFLSAKFMVWSGALLAGLR